MVDKFLLSIKNLETKLSCSPAVQRENKSSSAVLVHHLHWMSSPPFVSIYEFAINKSSNSSFSVARSTNNISDMVVEDSRGDRKYFVVV